MTEETPTLKKDVVPTAYRERYAATGGTNGDFIAVKLQEITKDGAAALATVLKENGHPENKYRSFNVGMQRMNVSNILRSAFLKGQPILILGKEYDLRQMLDEVGFKIEGATAVPDKIIEKLGLALTDRTRATLAKTLFSPPKKSAEDRAKERAEAKAKKDAEKAADKAAKADQKAKDKAAAAAEKAEKAAAAVKP